MYIPNQTTAFSLQSFEALTSQIAVCSGFSDFLYAFIKGSDRTYQQAVHLLFNEQLAMVFQLVCH